MVQTFDTTQIVYILPVVAFLLVSFVVFAVLKKLDLFNKSDWPNALISLFIASFFITAVGSISYIQFVGAWIAMLLVSMVFLLAITGMFPGDALKGFNTGIGKWAVAVAVVIFLVSALVVYSSYLTPYLPGGPAVGSYSVGGFLTWWIYSPRVGSAIILLIVSALVAWILTKSGK